jgi:hypothetical protein
MRGLPGQECQDSAARIGLGCTKLPGENSQGKTERRKEPEKESQNRSAGTGQQKKMAVQDYQDRAASTGLLA